MKLKDLLKLATCKVEVYNQNAEYVTGTDYFRDIMSFFDYEIKEICIARDGVIGVAIDE